MKFTKEELLRAEIIKLQREEALLQMKIQKIEEALLQMENQKKEEAHLESLKKIREEKDRAKICFYCKTVFSGLPTCHICQIDKYFEMEKEEAKE